MTSLKGKTVLVGVSGGIAAYKVCELVSLLRKQQANVLVMMTRNSTQFVSPLTFETLSGNPVTADTFVRSNTWQVEHISYAKQADVVVLAPATANLIAKLNNGIADDFVTTTVLATKAPIIIAPAMNTGMYTNESFTFNMNSLSNKGYVFVNSTSGRLACGDVGIGRMAEPQDILNEIFEVLNPVEQDMKGRNILVTSGGTIAPIDGVRYLTNRSSGKMGLCIADDAHKRGASVTLVLGNHSINRPSKYKVIDVSTTQEMYDAVMNNLEQSHCVIKAAAPCDYINDTLSTTKIKSDKLELKLSKTVDIACEVGKIKGNKVLVVFSAETENLIANASAKLVSKNADLCIANDVTVEGAGFDVDTNIATFIDKDMKLTKLPKLSKKELATKINDKIVQLLARGTK